MILTLKKINYNDEILLNKFIEWRNEEEARINFINSEIINIDTAKIIMNKYRESNIDPFIIYIDEITEIGIIYFIKECDNIYIGINIDKNFRCKGFGSIAINLIIDILKKNTLIDIIYSKIKKSNINSINLFKKFFKYKCENDEYEIYTKSLIDYTICSVNSYFFDNIKNKIIFNKFRFKFIEDNDYFKKNIIDIEPKKCFFLHWPYIVPKKIYEKIECINFHTGNLPEGRGGTPLQNQILEKIIFTKVNALKITSDGIDSGPSYIYINISLQGNIFDIFNTIINASYELMLEIINKDLKPEIIYNYSDEKIYNRIKNNELITKNKNLEDIYDQIRMRDYDYYEKTNLIIDNFKLSFDRAKFDGKKILCDVEIKNI